MNTFTDNLYCPNPKTVRGRILGALLRGNELTQMDSLQRFGDFRLAAHVEALRKHGWDIVTQMIEVKTGDAKRMATVARYYMPHSARVRLNSALNRYARLTLLAEMGL